MTTTTCLDVRCPACGSYFRVGTARLRRGWSVACPDCATLFMLNAKSDDAALGGLLSQAKQARRERRSRLELMQSEWRHP